MKVGFHNNRVVKSWPCSCFSVILIGSVFRMSENYYPQVFLEEYKYVVKENKISSDESNEYISGAKASDEEASDEE